MRKKPYRMGLPALILLTLTTPLFAIEGDNEPLKWYDVELIIFSRDEADQEVEQWPDERPYEREESEHVVELSRLAATQSDMTLPSRDDGLLRLGQGQLKLVDEAKRIEQASSLNLLLHTGWRQAGRERGDAPLLHLAATPTPAEGENGEPNLFAMAEMPPQLEGMLRVSLSRYLHLDSWLLYRLPYQPDPEPVLMNERGDSTGYPIDAGMVTSMDGRYEGDDRSIGYSMSERDTAPEGIAIEPQQPGYRGFLLNESRRMRSNQLHYLDHPLFGVVVNITPVELPPPPEPEAGVVIR